MRDSNKKKKKDTKLVVSLSLLQIINPIIQKFLMMIRDLKILKDYFSFFYEW